MDKVINKCYTKHLEPGKVNYVSNRNLLALEEESLKCTSQLRLSYKKHDPYSKIARTTEVSSVFVE